jgi:ABC-type multidrug transport system fused ATPase/permease subunit
MSALRLLYKEIKMKSKKTDHFSFWDVPRAIWYFVDTDRPKYLFFTSTLFIALFYVMVPPFIIGRIVDFFTSYHRGASLKPVFIYAGVLAASSAFIAITRLYSKRKLGQIAINARYRAKVWGFERLLGFSLSWHQQENTGNKAQRIITGAEAIREWTHNISNKIFPAIAAFTGSLIACMYLNPWFALFFIYFLGGLLLVEFYFDRRISILSDKINKSIENASGTLIEGASNILAVKAMGAGDSMASSVARREETARELSHKRIYLGTTKWMCFQIHNSMSWGIFIVLIALSVANGLISVGLILTYTSYFASLRESATDFTDHLQNMIEMKSNLGRMMNIFFNDYRLKSGDKKFPADFSSVRFDDITFAYRDKPAVRNLSIDVKRGEKIGIAGHSGSGKSTVIKLLLGLYHPGQGSLSFDSVSIKDLRSGEIASNIAVVLQETELFNLSLKDNITIMRDINPELFIQACSIAALDEIIARLPSGIDTLIGERGYALSGGERQRVGIARAICRNAPILLLDEATSALDSATEKHVMDGLLGEYSCGKTMLIVAHRISTLLKTDRIIVFENGEISEEGTFSELANDSATRFGQMYTMQSAQSADTDEEES